MEELLKQLVDTVNKMNENINRIDDAVHHLEQRFSRLEKMDSIEHRVTVNQIDITDIKEFLEKLDTFQREELKSISNYLKKGVNAVQLNKEIQIINKRLDAQLTKIAQHDEAILMHTQQSE